MKTTLILHFILFISLIFQYAFAGSVSGNHAQYIGNKHNITEISPKTANSTPQKWGSKLADSKIGKWAFKMGSRIFSIKGLNAGGFCLGFFLGLLGVLIAYAGKDADVIKSSWIGLISAVGLWLIIIIILLMTGGLYFDYGYL